MNVKFCWIFLLGGGNLERIDLTIQTFFKAKNNIL